MLGVPSAVPVIVAGSTHAGEEAALAHAARDLDAVLLIAPRHRERLAAAEKEIAGAGLVPRRLTQLRAAPRALAPGEALVVDTMGELSRIYAAADVAFVGGTLFPGIGGHNVFEPVLAGAPVVVGRHVGNVRSDVGHLAAAGALEMVHDPARLGDALRTALGPLGVARRTAARGAAAAARGSAARTFEFIARRALRDVPAGATTSLDPHERTQHG
jgi:3-deoxy-D-manno-octulosonic-acid transferase